MCCVPYEQPSLKQYINAEHSTNHNASIVNCGSVTGSIYITMCSFEWLLLNMKRQHWRFCHNVCFLLQFQESCLKWTEHYAFWIKLKLYALYVFICVQCFGWKGISPSYCLDNTKDKLIYSIYLIYAINEIICRNLDKQIVKLLEHICWVHDAAPAAFCSAGQRTLTTAAYGVFFALNSSQVCCASLFFITSSIKRKKISSVLRAKVGGIGLGWWNFATLSLLTLLSPQ